MLIQVFQIISFIVLFFYIFLIIYYRYQWINTAKDEVLPLNNKIFISVVIVGRNEGENLLNCINSILDNNYPKSLFEIIYIDDFSTDNSLELLKNINIENFNYYQLEDFINSKKINNYKKKGIEYAISLAKGDIILQTDADTLVGKNWLLAHANKYANEKINFVTGPVFFKANNSSLQQFQKYDFIATMGITCAGINSDFTDIPSGGKLKRAPQAFFKLIGR